MSLFLRDPHSRHALATGVLVAVAIVVTSVAFDLPWLASSVFPGLWVVLQSRRRRCSLRAP